MTGEISRRQNQSSGAREKSVVISLYEPSFLYDKTRDPEMTRAERVPSRGQSAARLKALAMEIKAAGTWSAKSPVQRIGKTHGPLSGVSSVNSHEMHNSRSAEFSEGF